MGYNPTSDASIYTLQRRIRRQIEDISESQSSGENAERMNTQASQPKPRRFSVARFLARPEPYADPAR